MAAPRTRPFIGVNADLVTPKGTGAFGSCACRTNPAASSAAAAANAPHHPRLAMSHLPDGTPPPAPGRAPRPERILAAAPARVKENRPRLA